MSTTAANSGVIITATDIRRLSQNQIPAQTNTIINAVDDNNQDNGIGLRVGGGLVNFPQQQQNQHSGSSSNSMIAGDNNYNHNHTDSNNNTHDNNHHHHAILMAKTSTTTTTTAANKMLIEDHHHQNSLDFTDDDDDHQDVECRILNDNNNETDNNDKKEKGEPSQADNEFCTCCMQTGQRIQEQDNSQTPARCSVCDGSRPRRHLPESAMILSGNKTNNIDQQDDNFNNNHNSDMFETNVDDDERGQGTSIMMTTTTNNNNSNLPNNNNNNDNNEEKVSGIQSCNNNNNRNGILIDRTEIQDSSTNNTSAAADSKIELPSVNDSNESRPLNSPSALAANTHTSTSLRSGSSASSSPSVVNLKSNTEHILGSSITTNSSKSTNSIGNNSLATPILSVAAAGGCCQSESNADGGDSQALPSSLSSKINQRSQLLLIKAEPESPPPNKQRPTIIPPPPPPPPPSSSSSIQSPASSSSISSINNSNSGGGNSTTPPTNNESSNNSVRTTPTAMLAATNGPLQAPNSNQTNMMDYHSQPPPPPPPPSLHHHQPQPQQQQQHQPSPQQLHGHGTLTLGGHQMSGTSPQTMLPMLGVGNNNTHHPQPQPTISVAAVVTAASSSPSSDPKDCIEELCPVCGDRVSGYHYGLLTCESCKGFFKRTVQNKKVYTCVADRNCHIDKSQRKRCPFCRFQKCLDVGMKLEAVRADRMRGGRNKFGPMYKRDRARRLQLLRQKQLSKAHHMGGGGHGGGHHAQPTLLTGSVAAAAAAAAAANEARNFLNTNAPGSHGGASSLFGDGVKPELIQIPQLSSSTSSPDSSPSPGSTAAAAAAQLPNAGSGGHHFMSPLVPSNLQTSNPLAAATGASIPSLMNTNEHILKWGANGPGPSNINTNNSNSNNNNNNNNPNGGSSKNGGLQPTGAHYDAGGKLIIPQLIRELQMSMPDDKEWQSQLFGLLQNQTYNQCEVDLFELMCKVIDQSLFAQVDWARNSIFFKELKVDDQMKLLQNAWSDMLVLDHIHQRLHAGLPEETTLPNGQKFDLLSLALLGVPQVADQLHRVMARLSELKVDTNDYICLKFLLLLNPEVRGLTNFKLVHDAHEQTKQALLDYCINFYPQITDKFNHLLSLVPEIHGLTLRGEDFLYYKHMNGSAPTQTLLMEMLHAKKK